MDGFGSDELEWWDGKKARVFISCGQRDEEERKIASGVRSAVKALGFCPYLAIQVQSSRSLTEGIYAHLRTAEYFLFVDFAREKLDLGPDHRGSLFSNQELAIASYLGLDSLYFVHSSVRKRDGIIGVIQGNPAEFPETTRLVQQISQGIAEALWKPDFRHELRIELASKPTTGALVGNQLPATYFHLQIRNLHHRSSASECRVQVLRIRDLTNQTDAQPDVVEMKFSHITWPVVTIPPDTVRQFDGMLVYDHEPRQAILGILNVPYVDSGSIVQQHTLRGPGEFEVDVAVYSREFSPARCTLSIHLGTSPGDAKLYITEGSKGALLAGNKATPENNRSEAE